MLPPPPAIAVIIVAHNAEATIEAAIRSVISQDFTPEYYIDVYDDCSDDGTVEVVNKLQERFSRLYLTKHRQHVGKATILRKALCKSYSCYSIVLDADDTMCSGALKALYEKAEATSADIVMAPFVLVEDGREQLVRPKPHIESLNDMPLDTVHFSLCNKLICNRFSWIYDSIPEGIDRWEDLATVAKIMSQDCHLEQIDRPVFKYIRRRGITTLSSSEKELVLADRLSIAEHLIRWFSEWHLSEQYAEFLRHLKFHAKVKYARSPHRDLRRWRATYPEINPHIMGLRHVPLIYRLLFSFAALGRR